MIWVLAMWLSAVGGASGAAADSVVTARATREHDGEWVRCGDLHVVGWVVYERVRVERGADPGARFVAVHSCPDADKLRGEVRLWLVRRKPAEWPDVGRPPPALPIFWATSP